MPRRSQDISPEQGSALYQEDGQPERSPENSKSPQEAELEQKIEITQRFEHEQFLEQVLQQGQSPKSQEKTDCGDWGTGCGQNNATATDCPMGSDNLSRTRL